MIRTITEDKNIISFDRKEVLRYSGCPGSFQDEACLKLVEECIEEVGQVIRLKACYDILPIEKREKGSLCANLFTNSGNLSANLKGCEEAFVFAATIGHGVDLLIRRYSAVSPAHAVAVQAVAAAAVEEWCDVLCDRFSLEAGGRKLKPRFSPGYGDFSIENQRLITEILDTGRKIGLSLTESCMMIPSKSVTAIVGICRD